MKIRFLHRTAELTVHDRLRSSDIQEEAQASYKDAPWLAPARAVSDKFDWLEPLGLTQNLLERTPGITGTGDRDVWNDFLSLLPAFIFKKCKTKIVFIIF